MPKTLKLSSVTLLLMIVASTAVFGCSIFMAALEGQVLFGNNIDDGNPNTYYEIVPAQHPLEYGFITLGFNQPQGGLNEAGLAFDTNAVSITRLNPQPDVPGHPEGPIGIVTKMLRTAATVEEALSIAHSYSWGAELRNQWFFADASGEAVVISAGTDGELAFTRKLSGDGYLISTNINRSNEELVRDCRRYRIIDRMLSRLLDRGEISIDAFTQILDAAHQQAVFLRDGVLLNTVYSNIFDLQTRRITLYYWFQFGQPLTLELHEELARGPLRVRVSSLFPEAIVRRAGEINDGHLERIERWRSFPWLQAGVVLALLGALSVFALFRN